MKSDYIPIEMRIYSLLRYAIAGYHATEVKMGYDGKQWLTKQVAA
jgi:hypothetical protein